MKEQLEKIEALAKQELNSCTEIKALDDLRIKFLGKKGELTAILKQMGKLSAEERPVIGQLANKVRADIEEALGSKLASLKANAQAAKLAEEKIDITLPGKHAPFGKLHPLTKVENEIKDAQTALQGAMDIIAEDISDDADIRKKLRALAGEKGELVSKASDPEAESVYMNYYEYSEAIPKVANHRVLALDRGEKEGFLKVSVTLDETIATDVIFGKYIKANNACGELVRAAAADSYKRLIFPSIEREIRSEMSAKAAEESIKVFAANLRQMLLQPPLKSSVILGLDPGYAHGCKTAVIDGTGKVLDTAIIYPVGSAGAVEAAKRKVKEFIQKYNVNVISIGNGTASRETESFAAEIVKEVPQDVSYMVVSEAGASVYSASKVAAEEFPEYDVSIRGAISIARRLQDPLAELVKIDPKAIGVGQYQHDMPQARMSEALGGVVEDCVNSVGVDLNTASHSLLSYIAGINATVAKNIVTYREENGRFTDRKELLKVPKLGKKAFEQCAGFLRVRDGKNPLDNTAVHPESYEAASSLLSECGFTIADIAGSGAEGITEKANSIGIENISKSLGIGVPTLTDIIGELKKPGRDLRDELPAPLLRSGDVMEIKDLKPGMELVGTVRNIIDFGCFVDIGVHEDGLVHISQICSKYIKHPLEAVKVGEVVKVRVLDVDLKRNRISLTMRLNDEEEKKQQRNERRPDNRKRQDRKPKGFDASQLHNSSFRIKQK